MTYEPEITTKKEQRALEKVRDSETKARLLDQYGIDLERLARSPDLRVQLMTRFAAAMLVSGDAEAMRLGIQTLAQTIPASAKEQTRKKKPEALTGHSSPAPMPDNASLFRRVEDPESQVG